MLQLRTTIQGEYKYLDIYKDEPVLVSFSFAELADITKKNSAYSQSFSLPGTKNNNEIFNFFFDINSVPLTFNPNNKFETIMTWNGYEIMQGYIRLDGVSINKLDIVYQVTFYNQIGDLAANIGDKFLYDLDLASLSHPYSYDVILQSQLDPNLFSLTGGTNYSYQNGKTMWSLYNIGYEYLSGTTNAVDPALTPLVEFTPLSAGTTYNPQYGYFDYQTTPVHDYYFKPTIQIKELYTRIVNQAGYFIESDFFDTSYFQKYYLPLKFLDDTVYSKNARIPCFEYTNTNISLPDYTTTGYTNPSINQVCNNLELSSNTTTFAMPADYIGSYGFRFTYTVSSTTLDACSIEAMNTNGTQDFVFSYYDLSGNYIVYTILAADAGLLFTFPGTNPAPISGDGYAIQIAGSDAGFYFTDGTQNISLMGTVLCGGPAQTISFDRAFNVTGASTFSFYFIGQNANVTSFRFQIISGPRFIPLGATIDYQIEFPENDYKQIDFLTSINRYFNLVMVPSPDKPKTLIVEPIIDYIGKGQVLDWTTKIDSMETQTLKPTTSLINGTLEYMFRLDNDYANQNYFTKSSRVFGTDKVQLNQEYKDQITRFDYMFSSPMDITINTAFSSWCTLSSMSKIKQQDVSGTTVLSFVPFKILPRLVFRGLTSPNDNYGQVASGATTQYQIWWMNTTQQDRFVNINRYTTYPFSYNNFSHYINWRGEDRTDNIIPEYAFVSEDLYDVYYKDYIDDLISVENKIYSCRAYLYPQEVQQLRYNEKILINNAYFRINKISNFNMLEPQLCDLELVKLTKEYRSHRVKYYDLTPCAGGSVLHSNSDLNYNFYAYAGNYVKLYNDGLNYLGCYGVSIGTYNSGYTYSHYYIASAYTENLVGVYPDCGCTGRTSFTLVQEPPEGATQTPTPTPTPTITPTRQTPTPTPTNTQTPSSTPASDPYTYYEVDRYECVDGICQYVETINIANLSSGLNYNRYYLEPTYLYILYIVQQITSGPYLITNLTGIGTKNCNTLCI